MVRFAAFDSVIKFSNRMAIVSILFDRVIRPIRCNFVVLTITRNNFKVIKSRFRYDMRENFLHECYSLLDYKVMYC